MTLFGVNLDWQTVAVILGGIGSSIGLAIMYYLAYRRGRIAVLKEDAERMAAIRQKADGDYGEIVQLSDDDLAKRASRWVRGGK